MATDIESVKNDKWRAGMQMEEYLHKTMREFVNNDTTFEDLFYYMNEIIVSKDFINLDFLGNLGHSIVKNKNNRVYIEKGNKIKCSDVEAFTFEPHIRKIGSYYGYKLENIYCFENKALTEL